MPQTKIGAGIELEAKDNASPAISRVGTMLGNLGASFANFGSAAGRFSPVMAGAAQGMGAMGTGAAGMMGGLGKLGPIIGVVGAAVAGLVIGIGKLNEMAERATQIITSAIDAFAKYETGLSEVKTIVRGTADEMQMLGDTAISMSTTFGTTATSQLKGFYQAASAGYTDVADASAIMTTANKLAVAGVADVEGSIGLLVASMKPFGIEAENAGHAADILFKMVEKGITTIPELAQHFSKVGPIAGISGVSFEETAAALAAITAQKVPTAQATTYLAGLFRTLTKITPEMTKALDKYGVSLDAARLKNEGLLPVLMDIKNAAGGDVGAMREMIREDEAFNAAAILTGVQQKNFVKGIDEMHNATGSMQAAFKDMSGDIDFQRKRWASFKDSVIIALGKTFAPLMHQALGVLEKFMDAMNALPAPVKNAMLSLAAVGLALPMIGGKITGLVWGTVKLGLAFMAVSAVLVIIGPMLIPLIVTVVGLAGAFGILAYTLVKKVLPGNEGLIVQLKKISTAMKMAYAFIKDGKLSGAMAEEWLKMDMGTKELAKKFKVAWDMTMVVFTAAKETVVAALDAMADSFGPGLNRVTDWIKGMLGGKTTAKEFAKSIPIEDLKSFGRSIGEVFVQVLGLGSAFITTGMYIASAFRGIKETWDTYIAPILGPILTILKMVGHTAKFGMTTTEYMMSGMIPAGQAKSGAASIGSMPGSSSSQIISAPPVHDRAGGGSTSVKTNINLKQKSVFTIDRKEITAIIKETIEEVNEDNLEGPHEMALMTS